MISSFKKLGIAIVPVLMLIVMVACSDKNNGATKGPLSSSNPKNQPVAPKQSTNATELEGFWMQSCTQFRGDTDGEVPSHSYHVEVVFKGNS